MHPVLEAINAHPLPMIDLRQRGAFVDNMLFVHSLIVASESLLIEALKCGRLERNLREFYEKHLDDERGHAAWLADDLASIGVTTYPIDYRAAMIAGAQYYLIFHIDPKALLGYMAALECRPMPLALVDELETCHGRNAVRMLRYHAQHDITHGAEVLALIDSTEDNQIIIDNAAWVALMLKTAMQNLERANYATH